MNDVDPVCYSYEQPHSDCCWRSFKIYIYNITVNSKNIKKFNNNINKQYKKNIECCVCTKIHY